MNSLRIRVVKLSNQFGTGEDYHFAIQLSTDGLVWWTVARWKTFEEALPAAKDLHAFIVRNQLVKPTHILWTEKV